MVDSAWGARTLCEYSPLSPTQNAEFSYTKVQDVVTNKSDQRDGTGYSPDLDAHDDNRNTCKQWIIDIKYNHSGWRPLENRYKEKRRIKSTSQNRHEKREY